MRCAVQVEEFLELLEHVTPAGVGRWQARCPAHEDRSPSLSVYDSGDKIGLTCHAGCEAADIIDKLGLESGDEIVIGAQGTRGWTTVLQYVIPLATAIVISQIYSATRRR